MDRSNALLTASNDHAIRLRLEQELADVERRFAAELHSELACVNELVRHVERYRGKRLRPMLVMAAGLASAQDGQILTDAHRVLAAVVEMVHMATLVHDDILDDAEVRRGGATINYLRGNETAVMLGDYLISHAYHLCAGIENQEISRLIADTTNVVCEGELLQLANRENWQLDEATYFDIIRRKTASLCGACCRIAAKLHGESGAAFESPLESYGEKLGLAFQIIDDLLDLTGSEDTVGKTLRRDLQKGKLTLPLIHFLNHAGPTDRSRLLALLNHHAGDDDVTDAMIAEVRALIVRQGSVDYANQYAQALIHDAKAALHILNDSPARDLMLEMAEAVISRKF